jgi:hypothetical protein
MLCEVILTLSSIPERSNSLFEVIWRYRPPICLVIVLHVVKRVVTHIAGVIDPGLYSPVPPIREQQLVTVEEAGIETAHVAIPGGGIRKDTLPETRTTYVTLSPYTIFLSTSNFR